MSMQDIRNSLAGLDQRVIDGIMKKVESDPDFAREMEAQVAAPNLWDVQLEKFGPVYDALSEMRLAIENNQMPTAEYATVQAAFVECAVHFNQVLRPAEES